MIFKEKRDLNKSGSVASMSWFSCGHIYGSHFTEKKGEVPGVEKVDVLKT